jgi:hypothetical protein
MGWTCSEGGIYKEQIQNSESGNLLQNGNFEDQEADTRITS